MKSFGWVRWLAIPVMILVCLGLLVKEWRTNQVAGYASYRFNLAVIDPDQGVTFVSFDPSEKAILALTFPTNLAINSRGSGEYSIVSLYKLGAYKGEDEGGKFVRQKIQGFMRVPIPGYLVINKMPKSIRSGLRRGLLGTIWGQNETSLSRFDAIILWYRTSRYRVREVSQEELVRSAVIDKDTYYPERLQEYVGTRLFDWGIGAGGRTVAIVNASGVNGLGSDMADFLSNLGFDVVMVRSVSNEAEIKETSEWQIGDKASAKDFKYIFQNLFGLADPKIESIPEEYRATILIKVGKDAKELF